MDEEEPLNLFPDNAICENCLLDEDAIAYCRECKRLLCDECLTFHKKARDTSLHETVDSPRADELKKLYCCPTHTDKTLDFFCKTCNTAVCQHCQITGCKQHEVVVSSTVKEDMCNLLDKVKLKREEFAHHAEFIEARIAQNTDAFRRCEGEVAHTFSEMARKLEEQKIEVLKKLREETEKNEARVKKQKEFVENTIREMNRTVEYTEHLLKMKKDAKLMVNKVKTSGELEGRALHEWNTLNATYRCWQLEHKEQQDYAEKFSSLFPKPTTQDIILQGLDGAHVGVSNVFTITASIKDQFDTYDSTTTTNFLSVKILFTPRRGQPSTFIQRKISREKNVWTVSYILRQHGTVVVSISLCGVGVPDHTLDTDPSKNEIKGGDVVMRGPDWHWDNQDGGRGCRGRVVEIRRNGWVSVKWDNAGKHDYRWGSQGLYDLQVVPE